MATRRGQDKARGARPVTGDPQSGPPQSGVRVKTLLRRLEPNLYAPSTLPPPPFESEADVHGLEWWLDAHMALAADQLCLAQALDSAREARSTHAEAVRQLSLLCDSVRDALYELYCDAAHPQAAGLPGFRGALKPLVQGTYGWCVAVVGSSRTSRLSCGPRPCSTGARPRRTTGPWPGSFLARATARARSSARSRSTSPAPSSH